MAHHVLATPSAALRDLRDIQHTVDRMVQQLAPCTHQPFDVRAARSLLAAVSYKLDHVQAALRH
ncbi:hypothetical protein [Paludibacterium purpuratum]|uniref:Uncharacterized protein n=1 Tax=Paludibacterium purpuratum TaxID=1144873 RepID=A0A4R7AW71_9NEIS|nr:hypothetical protein [Paludibacterium purpuratum]TDR71641.1 hypothetical protein DFP86_11852 [Paludibacterium purpuratum]